MANMNTLFVALAGLCWGISAGLGGILMADGWNALVVSLYRGAIGLLFVLIWLALRPGNNGLSNPRLWLWSAIAGLGVAGNFAFYFMSIAEGGIAVAATLMYCAPVFVYLVSFALKLERPTACKWLAIAIAILGIILMTRVYERVADDIRLLGVVTGLLSGLCYAVFIFGFKYAAPHGSPQAILVIAFAVLVNIFIWLGDTDQIMAVLRAQSWALFVALGVLGAGWSFILYIIGLNNTTPAAASILAMVEPVTASLFGVLVLNQHLAGQQILGMGLILVSVAALSANSHARWIGQ